MQKNIFRNNINMLHIIYLIVFVDIFIYVFCLWIEVEGVLFGIIGGFTKNFGLLFPSSEGIYLHLVSINKIYLGDKYLLFFFLNTVSSVAYIVVSLNSINIDWGDKNKIHEIDKISIIITFFFIVFTYIFLYYLNDLSGSVLILKNPIEYGAIFLIRDGFLFFMANLFSVLFIYLIRLRSLDRDRDVS